MTTGAAAGEIHQKALARLHSARVAKSRRRASLPRAGGRRLPLWGGTPSKGVDVQPEFEFEEECELAEV